MRYILWVLPLLEACDITNNGHQLGQPRPQGASPKPGKSAPGMRLPLGCYLGFYQEFIEKKNRDKW